MIYAVACTAIAVFMAAFVLLHIVTLAQSAITTSRDVHRTLRDADVGDDHREQVLQQASLELLRIFVSITIRGSLALGLSFLTLIAADSAGLASIDEVVTLLSSWEAIAVTSVVLTAAWLFWHKR